jgi:hypothetical protein
MITLQYRFDHKSHTYGLDTMYYLNPPEPNRSAIERMSFFIQRTDGYSFYNSGTKKEPAHLASLKASVKNNNHIWKYKRDII